MLVSLFFYSSVKDGNDSLCVMRGEIPVPRKVLAKGVRYKYAVYTKKSTGIYLQIKPLEDINSDYYDFRYLQFDLNHRKHCIRIILCDNLVAH